MDDSVFWYGEMETVDDDRWFAFSYEDGAIEFICSECEKSIWQGRATAEYQVEGFVVKCHEIGDNIAVGVTERHNTEPREYTILEKPELSGDIEPFLWMVLRGWSQTHQGPPIEFPDDINIKPIASEISATSGDASTKPDEERTAQDYAALALN